MKINPYDFHRMPQDVIDFKDEVTTIINFGKYAQTILYETNSTPTWTGHEGETVLAYVSSGGGLFKLYQWFYANSGWRYYMVVGLT